MGINTTVLPDNSVSITYAYDAALDVVNETLLVVAPNMYTLAVYNLGGDNLINWAPDQTGQTFFADLREKLHCTQFVAGVVSSTSDEGTSMSLNVPEQLNRLTLSDLQNLKTPYGRQYLAIAQKYGTLWGLS